MIGKDKISTNILVHKINKENIKLHLPLTLSKSGPKNWLPIIFIDGVVFGTLCGVSGGSDSSSTEVLCVAVREGRFLL